MGDSQIVKPPTENVEFETLYHVNRQPADFMFAFWGLSKRHDRYFLGFDHEDLDWISRVWDLAAKAADNWRLRQACERERDRYAKLCKDLKQGEFERKDAGTVTLNEASDWPPEPIIKGAIRALSHVGVTRLH